MCGDNEPKYIEHISSKTLRSYDMSSLNPIIFCSTKLFSENHIEED